MYRESYRIILSSRKPFTQIILAYILPLSLISLASTHLSDPPFAAIMAYQSKKNVTESQVLTSVSTNISDLLASPSFLYWSYQVTYTIYSLIFSLLATSAVIQATASIYSGQELTFTKIRSVVPKMLKGLILTYFSIFLVLSTYHIIAFLVLGLSIVAFGPNTNAGISILVLVVVFYLMGLLYMTVIWQLAPTVSVLEDLNGFQAMERSKKLIEGKMVVSTIIILKMGLLHYMLQKALERMVMKGDQWSVGMGMHRLGYASVCLSLLLLLGLFERVVQTVIYFACKSYHHENVDKFELSEYLQVYTQENRDPKVEKSDIIKQLCLTIFVCIDMVSKVAIVCLWRLLFLKICVKSTFSL